MPETCRLPFTVLMFTILNWMEVGVYT
jgi:hypothetical protein